MKKLVFVLSIMTMLWGTQGYCDAKEPEKNWFMKHLSGNVDFTSNYVFRGISNSNNVPAVQGGLTFTWESGAYVNVWGSNVNLTDTHNHQAILEIDSIVGVTNSIGNNFTYNIYYDEYNYPKARGLNYGEIIAYFTYHWLTANIGYSNNVFNTNADGTYANVGVAIPIPVKYIYLNDVTLSAGIGRYFLQRPAGNSYNDYNVMLAKKMDAYTFSVQWTDTNRAFHAAPLDGNMLVATVLVAF